MSKEIVQYDEILAAMAKQQVSQEKPTASVIGLRAGQLSYNGQPVPGNKLDAIIIASTHANLYYEGSYDPDNLTSPVCYAYGEDEASMAPHPSSAKPQAESCAECPHNKFGSAEKGKGKRCKNSRSLALVPANTSPEDVTTCEIAVLKLPVTSSKNWSQYVNKIATLYNRPTLGVITTISTQPDPKSQFKVVFQQGELTKPELLGGLIQRAQTAKDVLEKEYEVSEAPTEPVGGKKYK